MSPDTGPDALLNDVGDTPAHDAMGCIEHLQARFNSSASSQRVFQAELNQPSDLADIDHQLNNGVCSVRGLRNASLPVMRLPSEVLAMIFEALQPGPVRRFYLSIHESWFTPDICPFDWMYIREVCRRWRDIADGHAALWTTIPFVFCQKALHSRVALTRLFLNRSRRNSLIMHINLLRTSEPLFSEVFAHVPRVRNMLLVVPNPPTDDVRSLLSQNSAPALQSLSLSLLTMRANPDGGSEKVPTLFRDEMPSLQSLYIHRFISTALSDFRNLTQLKLVSVIFRQHWGGLERLLRNSLPTLVDLALHHILEKTEAQLPPADDPMQLRQPIQLLKLKKLLFEGTAETKLTEVMQLLKFPANAELFLLFDYCESLQPELGLAELFEGIANLGLLLADVTRVQIRAYAVIKDVYASGSTFAFQYSQEVYRLFPEHPGMTFNPYPRLDVILRRAQELWLDAPADGVDKRERQRIVGDACNTTKLYCALSAEFWVDALRIPPHPETPEEVSCPLLRELHLVDPRDVVLSATFLPVLLEYLVSRQRRNRQLQALYIYHTEGLMPLPEYFLCDDGEDIVLKEPTLQEWETWHNKVVSTLEPLNMKVEFITADAAHRPRMYAPAHCKVQSGGGNWDWQTWDANF